MPASFLISWSRKTSPSQTMMMKHQPKASSPPNRAAWYIELVLSHCSEGSTVFPSIGRLSMKPYLVGAYWRGQEAAVLRFFGDHKTELVCFLVFDDEETHENTPVRE